MGKHCEYISHMDRDLQRGALPGRLPLRKQRSSCLSFAQALYGGLIISHVYSLSNLNPFRVSAPSIPSHVFLQNPEVSEEWSHWHALIACRCRWWPLHSSGYLS